MTILSTLCWLLFSAAALLLPIMVLLQDGVGGGLAEAFGGTGAETFGVKARGSYRFTFLVATVFIVSAVLIPSLRVH